MCLDIPRAENGFIVTVLYLAHEHFGVSCACFTVGNRLVLNKSIVDRKTQRKSF